MRVSACFARFRQVMQQIRNTLREAVSAPCTGFQRASGGFSIDASVHLVADNRSGLERPVRYCARPRFALERLHALDTAVTRSTPLTPGSSTVYADGRSVRLLIPLGLVSRVATSPTPASLPRRARSERPAARPGHRHRPARPGGKRRSGSRNQRARWGGLRCLTHGSSP